MDKFIFTVYRIIVPKPIRTVILKKNIRRKIINHFARIPENEINEDQKEILKYLRNNPVVKYPSLKNNYSPDTVEVFYDHENGMRYVIMENKKLYFRKNWNKKRIQKGYSELVKEQDINSPHRYISSDFYPEKDSVIADIGAAEGNFSLSMVEKVKKIYLFEYDQKWIEAMETTFAPWKDKVEIISKYVSDFDDDKHIRLDTFFNTREEIDFLKIDVEGDEQKVLDGARKILSSNKSIKISVCTYHKENDEKEFTKLLHEQGFDVSCSKGYMIPYFDKKIKAPWIRRGLLRAKKG